MDNFLDMVFPNSGIAFLLILMASKTLLKTHELAKEASSTRVSSPPPSGGAPQPAVQELILVHGGTSHDVSPMAE